MTRIVQLEDKDPLLIETKDGQVWICRCGLSKDWPYCDSSHKQARKEEPGKMYAYTRDETGALQPAIITEPPGANLRP